jgi:hypothetical protein
MKTIVQDMKPFYYESVDQAWNETTAEGEAPAVIFNAGGAARAEGRGSGVTTREIMSKLHAQACAAYRAELENLKRTKARPAGFSLKQIDDMCAGFADGLRAMRTHMIAMGMIVVYDTAPEQTADTTPAPESR